MVRITAAWVPVNRPNNSQPPQIARNCRTSLDGEDKRQSYYEAQGRAHEGWVTSGAAAMTKAAVAGTESGPTKGTVRHGAAGSRQVLVARQTDSGESKRKGRSGLFFRGD